MGNTEVSAAILATVALVALVLLALTAVSYGRRRNRALLFLMGAFAVFASKNLLAAASVMFGLIPHEHLEVVEGLADLLVALLLISPFFLR